MPAVAAASADRTRSAAAARSGGETIGAHRCFNARRQESWKGKGCCWCSTRCCTESQTTDTHRAFSALPSVHPRRRSPDRRERSPRRGSPRHGYEQRPRRSRSRSPRRGSPHRGYEQRPRGSRSRSPRREERQREQRPVPAAGGLGERRAPGPCFKVTNLTGGGRMASCLILFAEICS